MEVKTKQYHLNTELVLQEPSGSPLTIQAITLTLTQAENEIIECRLAFQVSPNLYHHIDSEALFNLKSELRGPFMGGNFLSDSNIQIEVTLQPSLLTHLLENASNADKAAAYLLNLNQKQIEVHSSVSGENQGEPQWEGEQKTELSQIPASEEAEEVSRELHQGSPQPTSTEKTIDPLLNTESWLCLSAKQPQGETEAGFSTFWSYVSPAILQKAATSGEKFSTGIADFFKEWVEATLSDAVHEATNDFLEDVTNIFKDLATDTLSIIDREEEGGKLFAVVVNFFDANAWPVAQVEGDTALQLAFQGKNGQWNCYAQVNEIREEFVFYSLCPVNIPEDKRLLISEFLTRANYGLTIGNFEMDLDSGEIYYKTSIDVEGDRLSSALIRSLVYTNVMSMDQYLPGIMTIIYGNISPSEAIAQIEG